MHLVILIYQRLHLDEILSADNSTAKKRHEDNFGTKFHQTNNNKSSKYKESLKMVFIVQLFYNKIFTKITHFLMGYL